MSDQKLVHQNIVVKMAKSRCKSAQTSTKCWSISLKFGHVMSLYSGDKSNSSTHLSVAILH